MTLRACQCVRAEKGFSKICPEKLAAEEALTAMEAEDLRIGPFIYHAAVCAYVRAEDPEGGLGVLRRLHLDGERALVQTYDVLIKGFVLQEKLDRAHDVVRVALPVGAARYAATVFCL
jgi:hypothetical protein